MYGCFDPYLVYGFVGPSSEESLDADYVEAHGLRVWADSIIRCHLCNSVYGVLATLAPDGTCTVDPVEKAKVDAFYARFVAYHRARDEKELAENLRDKDEPSEYADLPAAAGYHLALTGEYESEHSTYELDP